MEVSRNQRRKMKSEETSKAVTPVVVGLDRWVRCVGIDNLQHVCVPESDLCMCGVKVKRKKLLRDDYRLNSCYECTY